MWQKMPCSVCLLLCLCVICASAVLSAAAVSARAGCLLPCVQLWATIGFSFNTPLTCTAVSSRIRKSYDTVIEPLDQVRQPRRGWGHSTLHSTAPPCE